MVMQQFVRLGSETHGWAGAWPPPDRLAKAIVTGTDITILVNPEAFMDDALTGGEFEVTYWTRVEGKTSKLEEGDAPSHIARGAKYIRETTDADA